MDHLLYKEPRPRGGKPIASALRCSASRETAGPEARRSLDKLFGNGKQIEGIVRGDSSPRQNQSIMAARAGAPHESLAGPVRKHGRKQRAKDARESIFAGKLFGRMTDA